jgi:hypothetical protein
MLATAAFAMLWAIARAAVQSITIDEAVSYLVFVRNADLHWYPGANNHLLNTLLERLSTLLFGVHHLSVRAPALLGAGVYISAAYRISRWISRQHGGSESSLAVQWPVFVCLVYNPFVFDYLVAARGYGLALGFLMWAIAAQLSEERAERGDDADGPSLAACAISSACVGLSLAANLSFAIVDFFALVAVFILACRRAKFSWSLLAATAAPALIVTLLLPATQILHMPKSELWYGANSLGETFSTIVNASLFRINHEFVSPLLYRPLEAIKDALPWLLVVTLAACAGYQLWRGEARRLRYLALSVAGVLVVTLVVHWICFRVFHLLLPKDRTGLYIAPLVLLIAGAFAAMPAETRIGRALRRSLLAALYATAGYFLLCLRLDAFKAWDFEADVQSVYSVLACLNQDRGIRDVGTFWMYAAPLNFYRVQSGHEAFIEFRDQVPYTPEQQVLVLNASLEPEVLSARGLKVLYKGKSTDVVIAATPESEPSLKSSVCLERPLP